MTFPFPMAPVFDITRAITILRPLMQIYAPTITAICAIASFPFLLLHFAGAEPKPNGRLLLHVGSVALGMAFASLSSQNLLMIADEKATTHTLLGIGTAVLGAIIIIGMYLIDGKLRKAKDKQAEIAKHN